MIIKHSLWLLPALPSRKVHFGTFGALLLSGGKKEKEGQTYTHEKIEINLVPVMCQQHKSTYFIIPVNLSTVFRVVVYEAQHHPVIKTQDIDFQLQVSNYNTQIKIL